MARLPVIFASAALAFLAIPQFPAYLTLPAAATIVDPNNTVDEPYGERNMPFGATADNLKRGHHVASRLKLAGVEFSDDNSWRRKVWNPIRQSLTAGGWVVKDYQDTNPPVATLQYLKNGVEAWIRMQIFSPEQIELDFIEVKPFTPT